MPYHLFPLNDEREHSLTPECWCEPRIEWADPMTGEIYSGPLAPMVIHNAADCRETVERAMKINGERGCSEVGKEWKGEWWI